MHFLPHYTDLSVEHITDTNTHTNMHSLTDRQDIHLVIVLHSCHFLVIMLSFRSHHAHVLSLNIDEQFAIQVRMNTGWGDDMKIRKDQVTNEDM